MASPKRPLEFRPYRVAMYAIFLAFTLTFIFCIIRSVAVDLYGKEATAGATSEQASVPVCTDELDVLFRKLTSRSASAVSPNQEQDWTAFTAEFEHRFTAFQQRCVEGAVEGGSAGTRQAFAEAAEKLDALRLHLSRCGEEGDRERSEVAASIARLRAVVRETGH